jgi:hypothetical protein
MTVQTSRKSLDFVALDYSSNRPRVQIIPASTAEALEPPFKAWKKDKCFTLRCYMSLQGEDSPLLSAAPQLYRYDWAFGITLVENFYWDWMGEFPDNGALAIHLVLEPDPRQGGPEMLPAGAVLSALHPGRNTKGFVEQMLPALLKSGGEIAKIGAAALPPLDYLASGLTFGSNILESSSGNRKNWFLYQFLDEKLQCPVVEWRIYRDVLKEYGPLIRGSLFLSVPRNSQPNPGKVRIWLRPQIHYCSGDEICYIIPTNQLKPEERVYIDVCPAS